MENVAEDKNVAKSGKKIGQLYDYQVHSEVCQLIVLPLVS